MTRGDLFGRDSDRIGAGASLVNYLAQIVQHPVERFVHFAELTAQTIVPSAHMSGPAKIVIVNGFR